MPYLTIPQSNLSPFIGLLIGTMKGRLLTSVTNQVSEIVDEFKDETICENTQALKNIAKKKDNIQSNVNSFNQRINKVQSIAAKLLALTSALKVIISVLRSLPIPTTPAVTVGTIVTTGDTLTTIREFVVQLEEDAESILSIVSGAAGITSVLSGILSNLSIIDSALASCEETGKVNIKELKEEPITKDQKKEERNLLYTAENGRQYRLEIREFDDEAALRRQVVARDVKSGRIALSGEKSYSSSIDILIKEIKFRLDTDLS